MFKSRLDSYTAWNTTKYGTTTCTYAVAIALYMHIAAINFSFWNIEVDRMEKATKSAFLKATSKICWRPV